jgi:hypothetical protein
LTPESKKVLIIEELKRKTLEKIKKKRNQKRIGDLSDDCKSDTKGKLRPKPRLLLPRQTMALAR